MYSNILIPTDGSELAEKAIQHGIALAKRIDAKATALTVLPPFHTFTTDTQMIEDTPAQYKARMQEHARRILGAVAAAAKTASIVCETVQVEHEHPYLAIIRYRSIERLRSDCHRLTRPPRYLRDCPRQRDGQGSHLFARFRHWSIAERRGRAWGFHGERFYTDRTQPLDPKLNHGPLRVSPWCL
jgi:hypothetical protein